MAPTSTQARAAVYRMWSRCEDRVARTQAARDAAMRRFEDQVDPDRNLTEQERAIRADMAMKAHMSAISAKAAAARKAKALARRSAA